MFGGIGIGAAVWMGIVFASGEQPAFRVSWILPTGLAVTVLGFWVLGFGLCRPMPKLRDGSVIRRRRRWGVAVLGVGVVALGQGGWVDERVRHGGWVAAVPTDVLIEFMPSLPRHWIIGERDGREAHRSDLSLYGRINRGLLSQSQIRHAARRAIGHLEVTRSDGARAAAAPVVVLAALGSERQDAARDDPDAASAKTPSAADLLGLIPVIVDELDDPDRDSFEIASAGKAILYGAWRLDNSEESRATMRAAIDPHVPALLEILERGGQSRVDLALGILVMAEARPEVLDAIVECFESDVREENAFTVRTTEDMEAPRVLVEMAPHQIAASDRVVAILREGTNRRLVAVAILVRVWGLSDPRVGEALLGLLGSDDHARYTAAAVALPGFPDANARAIPRYLELLESDPSVGGRIGRSLWATHDALGPFVDGLLGLTRATWPGTRLGAWKALEGLFRHSFTQDEPIEHRDLRRVRDAAREAWNDETDESVREVLDELLWFIDATKMQDAQELEAASEQ